MTYEERVVRRSDDRIVSPAPGVVEPVHQTVVDRQTVVSPSGGEVGRRIVVLVFGIIQALIVLRIVLLLLNAREGNDLVAFILNTSQVFVAPFVGIFNNDALKSGGSVLDIAAIAALVGWTILEAIVLWIVNVFRRETV
ncbi:MAG: YggT family protein [Chloroflexi bacterium]|nr:YggT family protein [Chloroflexota bacterium]